MFGAVFAFVFGLVVTAFNAYRVVRLWDDRAYYERAVLLVFGPYSREFRRGIVRGWLPLSLAFAALTISAGIYLCALLAGLNPTRTLLGPQMVLIGLFVLGCALTLAVTWFNTPGILVPPYLRSEPGYWQATRTGEQR